MAERLYVSNKNETVRMFESDFMEFFSRVHPVTPLVLYMPVDWLHALHPLYGNANCRL